MNKQTFVEISKENVDDEWSEDIEGKSSSFVGLDERDGFEEDVDKDFEETLGSDFLENALEGGLGFGKKIHKFHVNKNFDKKVFWEFSFAKIFGCNFFLTQRFFFFIYFFGKIIIYVLFIYSLIYFIFQCNIFNENTLIYQ